MAILNELEKSLFTPLKIKVSSCLIEKESQEYNAVQFEINDSKAIYRLAKQTPKKVGQFVTCWKRNKAGVTEPFHESDNLTYYYIQVNSRSQKGLFIFPKNILLEKGIIATINKDGKRGFRVYPIWDKPTSKQAIKTQSWQANYFVNLNNLDLEKVRILLSVIT